MIVDYPSRNFTSPLLDALAAINGIIFVYNLSQIITKLNLTYKKWLIAIGENSIGILFFHFLMFKLVFVIFNKFNIISMEELKNVVAPSTVGNRYWILISFVGITGSYYLWCFLCKIPIVNFFLGNSKEYYTAIYEKMESSKANEILQKSIASINTFFLKNISFFFKFFRENSLSMILFLELLLLLLIPLYKQGIMCNDELQARFWSMQGFRTFYDHYFIDHIEKGRALSSPLVSFTMWLGFIFKSNWGFKIIQIISILCCYMMFVILVKKIFKNTNFSLFCGMMVCTFLPITFEHTAPNAFVTLYNIWLIGLMISMFFYIDYLRTDNRKKLIVSMILLLISCISYEGFVTFVPVYFIFIFAEKSSLTLKGKAQKCIMPFLTGVLYLILYIASKYLFPSGYAGNQIGFTSITNSLEIIFKLFIAELPGNYIFSAKYRYLFDLYNTWNVEILIKVILIGIIFTFLCFRLQKQAVLMHTKRHTFFVILSCFIAAILPTIPISISAMYQTTIGENGFMALPITFFGYFPTVLMCCYIIWNIWSIIKPFWGKCLIIGAILFLLIPIQFMNNVFAEEQLKDFENLQNIESFISSDTMKRFDDYTFYSNDMYKRYNALAIHDDYWTSYAIINDRNISFIQGNGTKNDNHIYIIKSGIYALWINNNLVIFSDKILDNTICIPDNQGSDYVLVNCQNAFVDSTGWYIYAFSSLQNGFYETPIDSILCATTLSTCSKIKGYYEDGWLERESQFEVKTGELGEIHIKLYQPKMQSQNDKVDIYVNNIKVKDVVIEEDFNNIIFKATPNTNVTIDLKTNFIQEKDSDEDIRELSLILSELVCY